MAKADLAARALLQEFQLHAPPVDPVALAKLLGVLVVPQQLDDDVSGMLLRKDGSCVIGVNRSHTAERRRFTVAHELGHLRLHEGRPLILDTDTRVNYRNTVSSMATDREEIDANRFAAALLAPEAMVRQAVRSVGFRTTEELVRVLSGQFQMSEIAMTYRLMNLGIVSGPAR
ncbi:ImmA/IrrE family metallo-endopeptidase [Kitasatospora aureofaciens]|uniref:ImmA/IrrE family metallo-endopeptidase n=1 Tax=Kitasatospora aureofaciens TaxID=1894 RepID=UPI0009275480|nr:ImmA/IrrE family metallo-endopeptidase [Streptomyces viridifaciens]UKZ07416.1 ImmA/IrrE family metallo-endopeptidase [Streptomyces viridifaciens]